MYPRLSEIPHISSYPVLLLVGFLFAWILARSRCKRFDIEPLHVDNLSLLLLLMGPLGSRLFARWFYMPNIGFWEGFLFWKGGGLVFYGGLVFGVASAVIYGLWSRISLRRFLDLLAPSVAMGLAWGRIGCFLAGCCWGDVCVDPAHLGSLKDPQTVYQIQTLPPLSGPALALSIQFPERSNPFKQHQKLGLIEKNAVSSLPVHPVQLYEAALAFALCYFLHRKKGPVALHLLWGYSLIRILTEFFRADNQPIYLGMTFSQVMSLVILGICFAVSLRSRRDLAIPIVPYKPRPASAQI